jgi:hypothetical protein
MVTVPVLGAKLPVGLYDTWMVWLPAMSVLVVKAAMPEPFSGTLLASVVEVVVSVNVAVPVGVPLPDVTVAVIVSGWP